MNPTPSDPQSNPSPFEQQGKKRSYFRIIAFIVAVHVVFLGGLLIQGCKPDDSKKTASPIPSATTNEAALPQENASYYNTLEPASNVVTTGSNATANVPTNYPTPDPVASNTVAQPVTPILDNGTGVAPTQPGGEYAIKAGDTYGKIAKSQGVSVKAISAANPGVDPAKLKIGQKIQIPASQAAVATTPKADAGGLVADKAAPGGAGSYAVVQGDSLIKIAKAHGVSVKTLKASNGLKTDRIHVGQKLKIPTPAPTKTASGATNPPSAN